MKKTYEVSYRVKGHLNFVELPLVLGDGIEPGQFRWFLLEDDTLIHIPLDSEVYFDPHRNEVIKHEMSVEAGQPLQRA